MTRSEDAARPSSEKSGGRELSAREHAYARVQRVRRSTQQFVGTLRRTTAEVSDGALYDRGIEQARQVMALMIANVSLAQLMLDRIEIPVELVRPAE